MGNAMRDGQKYERRVNENAAMGTVWILSWQPASVVHIPNVCSCNLLWPSRIAFPMLPNSFKTPFEATWQC